MKLSKRIRKIEQSGTTRFSGIKSLIDFSVGEPDPATPMSVIAATKQALDNGITRYSPVSGMDELKKKIGSGAKNTIITNGSKQALFNIFQVICEPGDEVIIPVPAWPTFESQVKLAGAVPVFANTNKFQLDLAEIKKKITDKTKAIVINSPNNPTGAVYDKKVIESVINLGFFVIADSAYEDIVYDNVEQFDFLENRPENVIVVKSFSKTYSMTGFRVGYCIAHESVIDAMTRLQSHSTGNVCSFAQHGAIAALELSKKELAARRTEFEKKRDLAFRLCSGLFSCVKPLGAFYLFPEVNRDSDAFAEKLLKKGVAVVPGSVFGFKKHIRISYARPEKEIIAGFKIIEELL